ncbi:MAG TPA: hypothetical protein VFB42_03445 [Gaiellaceae bacterium]|nr:hypothetical protein [Gaiellaceae bacterium]
MKGRIQLVTLAVAATAALGTQAAQARMLVADDASVGGTVKVVSSASVLAIMQAAGTSFHAAANYRNEKHLVAPGKQATRAHVRPDDRSGPRL